MCVLRAGNVLCSVLIRWDTLEESQHLIRGKDVNFLSRFFIVINPTHESTFLHESLNYPRLPGVIYHMLIIFVSIS